MAATKTRKKKPAVSGKAAITSNIIYRIKVKAKQRYHEMNFDEDSGPWENVELAVDQDGNNVRIQPTECETQIQISMATLKALMEELEKKVEVK